MSQLNGLDLNLNQAIIKGKMEQKVNTARVMLGNGSDITTVSNATGLSSDSVSKLGHQTNSNGVTSMNQTPVQNSNRQSSAEVFDAGSGASNALS